MIPHDLFTRERMIVLGQLIMTAGVTAVTGYLFATGQMVPPELLVMNSTLVGYYFGSAAKSNGAYEAGRKVGQESNR